MTGMTRITGIWYGTIFPIGLMFVINAQLVGSGHNPHKDNKQTPQGVMENQTTVVKGKMDFTDVQKASNEIGLRLHKTHKCRVCETTCGYCKYCGYAHCFNGHDHEGFDDAFENYYWIKMGKENYKLMRFDETKKGSGESTIQTAKKN